MAPNAMRRWATFALPTLAVAVAALVFLGPGKPRPGIGARVWGSPTERSSILALRVEGIRRLYGVDDAIALEGLTIELRSAGGEHLGAWSGNAGLDGIAEALVRLEKEASGSLELRVMQGEKVLAEGPLARRPWEPTVVEPGVITGAERGDCTIRVEAPRGHLVAPFEEELSVELIGRSGGSGSVNGEPSIEVVSPAGVEVRPERAILDAGGRASLRVKALAHNVELSLKATDAAGKSCVWEGYLPVVPGAMWLDPLGPPGELRIVSPAPRERAYLSLVGDEGRVFGAVVPLARDEAGFSTGKLAMPDALRSAKALHCILAGDPYEQGAGTVAWPLALPEGKVKARSIELLIDGMPSIEAHEKDLAASARRAGALVIVATALVEVFLLLLLRRSSRRKLAMHFAGATEGAEDKAEILGAMRDQPLLVALTMISLVVLAFTLVIAFTTLR